MPVNLYYTQRVRGFQQESEKYTAPPERWRVTASDCPPPDKTSSVRQVISSPLGGQPRVPADGLSPQNRIDGAVRWCNGSASGYE